MKLCKRIFIQKKLFASSGQPELSWSFWRLKDRHTGCKNNFNMAGKHVFSAFECTRNNPPFMFIVCSFQGVGFRVPSSLKNEKVTKQGRRHFLHVHVFLQQKHAKLSCSWSNTHLKLFSAYTFCASLTCCVRCTVSLFGAKAW